MPKFARGVIFSTPPVPTPHIEFTSLFRLPQNIVALTLTENGKEFRGWVEFSPTRRMTESDHVDSCGHNMAFSIGGTDQTKFAHEFVKLFAADWPMKKENGVHIWRRPEQ